MPVANMIVAGLYRSEQGVLVGFADDEYGRTGPLHWLNKLSTATQYFSRGETGRALLSNKTVVVLLGDSPKDVDMVPTEPGLAPADCVKVGYLNRLQAAVTGWDSGAGVGNQNLSDNHSAQLDEYLEAFGMHRCYCNRRATVTPSINSTSQTQL